MSAPLRPGLVRWIEASVGGNARISDVRGFPPSSTEMHAVGLDTDRGTVRVVVRRYDDAERLSTDFAYDPANEVTALGILGPTDVPAPRLFAADLDGIVDGSPILLESWVDGREAWEPSDLEGYLRRAAEVLACIHEVDRSGRAPVMPYRPYVYPPTRTIPRGARRRRLWERVRAVLDGAAPVAAAIFIHRDYHPGNALWDGETVSGVVDWSTAANGPAGIDLARMRQNVAGFHGAGAANRFAHMYVVAGGDADARHPYWDLLDAEIAPGDDVGAPGNGATDLFEDYVEGVLAELG